jgi:predicted small secreted protein
MTNIIKKLLVLSLLFCSTILTGCADDARVASHNLSKAADNFQIMRRVVFMTRDVSTHHYRVTFKPQVIIPDFDLKIGTNELIRKRSNG